MFTRDPAVLEIGVSLLFVAAVFQLFDGLQGVTTGALRGLGDTRTAMLWNLAGHWVVGLPLGYLLCFRWGLGVVGLWWGLSVGLIICGVALILAWLRKAPALLHENSCRSQTTPIGKKTRHRLSRMPRRMRPSACGRMLETNSMKSRERSGSASTRRPAHRS